MFLLKQNSHNSFYIIQNGLFLTQSQEYPKRVSLSESGLVFSFSGHYLNRELNLFLVQNDVITY